MPSAPKWLFDVAERLFPRTSQMVVTQTELLSASVRKISFKGDFSRLSFKTGAYMDFRVSGTEARRYTPAFVNDDKSSLSFIAHLHGKAPGSEFMARLKVGEKVAVNPLRSYNYYKEEAKKYVIFGDETSLGLACSFFSVLKQNKHPFLFYLELAEENRHVPEQLGLENCVVLPRNGSFRNEAWVSQLPVLLDPDWQDAHFVLTGNVKSARTFRKVIKEQTRGSVYLHGYWLEGRKGL